MAKQRGKSSTKRTALKVEVKVPVTHADYKLLQGPSPRRDYKTREHEVMATQRFASLNFCRTEEKKPVQDPVL